MCKIVCKILFLLMIIVLFNPYSVKATDDYKNIADNFLSQGINSKDQNERQEYFAIALENYNKQIKTQPKDYFAYISRANAYKELKNYKLAIKDYDNAIKINNKLALAYYNKAALYLETKDYERALVNFTKSIDADPEITQFGDKINGYFGRADTYYFMGKTEEALENYKTAFAKTPKNTYIQYKLMFILYETQQFEDALMLANTLIISSGESYYLMKTKAQILLSYNKPKEALAIVKNLINKYPKNIELYGLNADIYMDLKDYKIAIKNYSKAIELNPLDTFSYINRSVAYSKLNKYKEALSDVNKVIELDNTNIYAYTNKGEFLSKTKQYKEAIDTLEFATTFPGDLSSIYNNLIEISLVQADITNANKYLNLYINKGYKTIISDNYKTFNDALVILAQKKDISQEEINNFYNNLLKLKIIN